MNIDRMLGLGAVLLAIPVAAASWGYGAGSPNSPGAGFWPLVIAVAMVGLGLSLVLYPTPKGVMEPGRSRWSHFGISLGTLAFYVIALEPLGYLLTTALLLFVQLRWVESYSGRLSAGIAIVTAVASLLLFRVLLNVSLPTGLIPLPQGW